MRHSRDSSKQNRTMVFCAFGRMRRIGRYIKCGQVSDMIQSVQAENRFFFFLSLFLLARRHVHYTIKFRKVRLHNYCFGSSFPFRRDIRETDSRSLDFSRIVDPRDFHASRRSFWKLSRVSVSPAATATSNNAQSLLEAASDDSPPRAKVGKVSLDSHACLTYISPMKEK